MIKQLGLILQQLKEISEQIDDSLKQRIIRSKHTNDYYEKIKKTLNEIGRPILKLEYKNHEYDKHERRDKTRNIT